MQDMEYATEGGSSLLPEDYYATCAYIAALAEQGMPRRSPVSSCEDGTVAPLAPPNEALVHQLFTGRRCSPQRSGTTKAGHSPSPAGQSPRRTAPRSADSPRKAKESEVSSFDVAASYDALLQRVEHRLATERAESLKRKAKPSKRLA